MTHHFVEFEYPDFIVSEIRTREIEERSVESITLPENSYGFRFYDMTMVYQDGEVLKGNHRNISGWYYIGTKLSYKDAYAAYGYDRNYRILLKSLKDKGFTDLVLTPFGTLIGLTSSDTVLSSKTKKKSSVKERLPRNVFPAPDGPLPPVDE